MEYEVVFVQDDELPEGKDWALLRAGSVIYAFIKASRLTADVLSEAWSAFVGFTALTPAR
jgi:hypothetical protein